LKKAAPRINPFFGRSDGELFYGSTACTEGPQYFFLSVFRGYLWLVIGDKLWW